MSEYTRVVPFSKWIDIVIAALEADADRHTTSMSIERLHGELINLFVDQEINIDYVIDLRGLPIDVRETIIGGEVFQNEWHSFAFIQPEIRGLTEKTRLYIRGNDALERLLLVCTELLEPLDSNRFKTPTSYCELVMRLG